MLSFELELELKLSFEFVFELLLVLFVLQATIEHNNNGKIIIFLNSISHIYLPSSFIRLKLGDELKASLKLDFNLLRTSLMLNFIFI